MPIGEPEEAPWWSAGRRACASACSWPGSNVSWEAAATRVRVDTSAGARWYLSAEATALFKLLFFRAKDKLNLDNLLQVRGSLIDGA